MQVQVLSRVPLLIAPLFLTAGNRQKSPKSKHLNISKFSKSQYLQIVIPTFFQYPKFFCVFVVVGGNACRGRVRLNIEYVGIQ